MTQLRAVIFDVDGTLVDSERDGHRVAFNSAFAEAGLPDRWDVEEYGQLLKVAGGAQRLAFWFEQHAVPAEQARELAHRVHRTKTRIMRQMASDGQIRARPGARELIERLRSRGVRLHVATTGTRAWVEPLLKHAFGEPFDTVTTGTEVPVLKPSPAVYLDVLIQTGLSAEQVVAVEDSANGVRSAVAAGLRCVAAQNAYTRTDDLSAAVLVADGLDDPELVTWFDDHLE
ncbi:HAD-IA family hydrolase [Nocardia sp. PE-7]|uniref:HAD family hydrolase n=1 Tax=Nocardia sp. PE-7 TaxID=3058426 RepID=UPI00265AF764|nr:HAD-IA family hydrolase [Nocardia sp. PE-7]WKG07826.1 HAD-IA family hydrolase [Nocardia sp. PE-7]